jgi:hypothetical protein
VFHAFSSKSVSHLSKFGNSGQYKILIIHSQTQNHQNVPFDKEIVPNSDSGKKLDKIFKTAQIAQKNL